jgi:hypothetical protein
MPDGERQDRNAYLEEQIQRQKRGEPIDVDWVRSELERVNREAQRKVASSQKRLRWLVLGMAVLFCGLWAAGNLMNQHDVSAIVPIVVIVGLAAWALYRQRRA